jgi:hypothetical protein
MGLPPTHCSGCRVVVRDADGAILFEDADCELRAEPGELLLTWFDDGGPVVWVGRETAPGSYALVCRSRPRAGVLELAGDARRLHGSWRERDRRGTWSVELPPEAA